MPIFSKKFEIKTIPLRGKRLSENCPVIQEKMDDYKVIGLSLNKKTMKFIDGNWICTNNSDVDEVVTMKRRIKKLEEANHLHAVKIEVLLDMLTENLAEMNALKSQ